MRDKGGIEGKQSIAMGERYTCKDVKYRGMREKEKGGAV
jgi:hypothetical protein